MATPSSSNESSANESSSSEEVMRDEFTVEAEEEEVEAVADDNHGEENAHKVRRGVPWALIKGFGFTKGYRLHRGDPWSVERYDHRIVFTADRDAFNVNGIWRNVDDPQSKFFLEVMSRKDTATNDVNLRQKKMKLALFSRYSYRAPYWGYYFCLHYQHVSSQ